MAVSSVYLPPRRLLAELERMLRRDFPSVRRIAFFDTVIGNESTKPGYYVLSDSGSGEVGQFDAGVYLAGGVSIIPTRFIGVLLPSCNGLDAVVETSIHEAAHVELKSETCDVPNQVSLGMKPFYLKHLKVFK